MSPELVCIYSRHHEGWFPKCCGVSVWGQYRKMVCPTFSEVGRVAGREDNWLANWRVRGLSPHIPGGSGRLTRDGSSNF